MRRTTQPHPEGISIHATPELIFVFPPCDWKYGMICVVVVREAKAER
jgi:hypothetical protein